MSRPRLLQVMQQRTMAARGLDGNDAGASCADADGTGAAVPADVVTSVETIKQRVHVIQPSTGVSSATPFSRTSVRSHRPIAFCDNTYGCRSALLVARSLCVVWCST